MFVFRRDPDADLGVGVAFTSADLDLSDGQGETGREAAYAALAARLGMPRAVRAVAGACAANRLAVAIPCHRVLRGDGALAGYRWGVERKRELLARERETS